jgi:hypothetical protein
MKTFFTSILILGFNLAVISQSAKPFEVVSISFKVEPVIEINDCIKWHVDFRELKSTVLFRNHIISMGLYGGMVAIDSNLTGVNKQYSNKLNSDLYTNLTVRHDTLFAEKFNNIYFLSLIDTTWKAYSLNEPVALFDILFEDEEFVFYSISQGEWGTMLFVYDKSKKLLRATPYQDDPKCVYFKEGQYYINAGLRHGSGSSSFKRISNPKSIAVVSTPQNFRLLITHFNKLPVVDYPPINLENLEYAKQLENVINIEYGIMVNNTTRIMGREFHFTDYNQWKEQSQSYDKTYITEIVDKKLNIVDSINAYRVLRTKTYNQFTIIESKFISNGTYLSKGNSIFRIVFKGTPDHDFWSNRSTTKYVKGVVIPNCIDFFRTVENNTFNYTISSDTSIIAKGAFDPIRLYFNINGESRDLKLLSSDNILSKACTFNGNTLLYFDNLGNQDHKYSLLEIYDMNKFIDEYTK